jgi:tRNA-splicing ligase RtcB
MKIYGNHDDRTIQQLEQCVAAEDGSLGVLCADGHVGYSMPIGGSIGYRRHVSPSGVGYDIACGNMAVRTSLRASDVNAQTFDSLADEIARRISFGIGRKNDEPVIDSPVFDRIAASPVEGQRKLLQTARAQLGTVGSGNHYVDVLEDETGLLWIGVHFGSRGFGWKTAKGFMNIANGLPFEEQQSKDGEMFSPPLLFDVHSPSGQDYLEAMEIAGEYAYAGREAVVQKVLDILGAGASTFSVHNHHNFTWKETHFGESLYVVRKGATPAFPGQWGFVGGSMGDVSVILRGVDSPASAEALYSTVHGAGRVMSRAQARKGKSEWWCGRAGCTAVVPHAPKNMKCPEHGIQLQRRILEPAINFRAVQDAVRTRGTVLRGGGADEAPAAYRPLQSVLDAHVGMIQIVHTLTPRIVVMAGAREVDPYKD